MQGSTRIEIAPGEGIGPEVVAAARDALAALKVVELADAGAVPSGDAAACLAGPAGEPAPGRVTALPAKGHLIEAVGVIFRAPLVRHAPLRKRVVAGTNLVLMRELGEDEPFAEGSVAAAVTAAERREGRLCCALPTDHDAGVDARLHDLVEGSEADLELRPAPEVAAELVAAPSRFDVILAPAREGAILATTAKCLTGLPHTAAGALLGGQAKPVFGPAHGAAGDLAGRNAANPVGAMQAASLLLEVGLGDFDSSQRLEAGIDFALETGLRTPEIFRGDPGELRMTTDAIAAAVAREVSALLNALSSGGDAGSPDSSPDESEGTAEETKENAA